ncbi:MAG TPA: hypothetical protein VKN63_06335 [Afifellaceae bacterium]|nr:hypothetical protein [Afifellaceae bacterium]
MTYVIVTAQDTVVGRPFTTFDAAFAEAGDMFGDNAAVWVSRNVRIEENR